jgi:hypothetical protein
MSSFYPKEDPYPGYVGDLEIAAGHGVCDFCSPPQDGMWVYPCKSFILPIPLSFGGRQSRSDGAWGACKECGELIENDDRKGLLKRGLAFFGSRPELVEYQRKVIDLFMKNRTDEPRVLVEGDQLSEFYGGPIIYPEGQRP